MDYHVIRLLSDSCTNFVHGSKPMGRSTGSTGSLCWLLSSGSSALAWVSMAIVVSFSHLDLHGKTNGINSKHVGDT